MKKITIIYPDGKPHNVLATSCELYEINGINFAMLAYIDQGRTCITMLQSINGEMYKVPFHDIDFSQVTSLGHLPLENIPEVMSTVIFRDDLTEQEEVSAIQEIANETYARPEWLTATAVQRQDPPHHLTATMTDPTPHFEHALYTTYYYDTVKRPVDINRNAIIYEHRYGLYEHSPQQHTEFYEKPVLFREITDAIQNYVYEHGQNIAYNEELAPIVVSYEAKPGTTVADFIKTPDGKLRQVLLLVKPGVHEYTVHFGKCPYKELHRLAKVPENTQVQIIDDGTLDGEIEDVFRQGFNLQRQIVIGNESFGYGELSHFDFDDTLSQINNPSTYRKK